MFLTCNDLEKICRYEIEYLKSHNKDNSEELCLSADAHKLIIKFIEEAKNLDVDEKSRTDFVGNKCINALGKLPTSNTSIENAEFWNSPMLHIWNLTTIDMDDLPLEKRTYLEEMMK